MREMQLPCPVGNSVPFKIASAEKSGAVLTSWTVYEASSIELAPVEESVAIENGGAPPFGDPDLVFFFSNDYMDAGVKMHTYIGLWNIKLIDSSMSTEELYDLGGDGKSYYAVANWTTGTVLETTVNGQPARLEIASDISAVDSNLAPMFSSVEQLKDALLQKVFASNESFAESTMKIAYMDIVLKIQNQDGVWVTATPENFLKEGIEVVIPYPEGAKKDSFMFSVLHMFTHGSDAGSIEVLTPEVEEDGLHVIVHSLSPFAVAYQEVEEPKETAPATSDTASLLPWLVMMAGTLAAGTIVVARRKTH